MNDLILLARIDALKRSLERVEASMKSVENKLDEKVWGTFHDTIVVPAKRRTHELEDIRQVVSAEQEDNVKKEAKLKDAWEKYGRVHEKSERIFAECVEFLGGLALRERDLDGGICQLSDELMDKCVVDTGASWHSLTIPARQEFMTVSLARIIRLCLPEWTIWTLPLAAHQFGRMVVDLKTEWQDSVKLGKNEAEDEHQLYDLVADGLATYLMGPAYACAAIRLSFDPSTAYTDVDEHVADAKRAYVVFAMLRRMNEIVGKGVTPPYDSIIKILEGEWENALWRTQPRKKLEKTDKQRLDTWVGTMWQMFEDLRPTALYPHVGQDGWQVAQIWNVQLLEDMQIEPSGIESLRDALNAAWLCRTDNPNKVSEIEYKAYSLCNRIVAKKLDIKGKGLTKKAKKQIKQQPTKTRG